MISAKEGSAISNSPEKQSPASSAAKTKTLVVIDPGSSKSGVAVMSFQKNVLEKKIVPSDQVDVFVEACIEQYKPDIILMGNGTWSKKIRPNIKGVIGDLPLEMINEKHSTERGKLRYFKDHPPRGLWKLVPVTMQVPKEPYDDYAAIVMAEDYLDRMTDER